MTDVWGSIRRGHQITKLKKENLALKERITELEKRIEELTKPNGGVE